MTLLFETVSGSRAYGTAIPGSDTDIRGVFGYVGFVHQLEETRDEREPVDRTLFELRKFFRLAAAANPNVIELLFIEPKWHRRMHKAFERVLSHRDMFLSKRVGPAHAGFAKSQLALFRKKRNDKAAYHLVRLTRMCLETLRNGTMQVLRPDADELLEIRRGAWSLEKLESYAEDFFAGLDAAVSASKLSETPDMEALDRLCIAVYQDILA